MLPRCVLPSLGFFLQATVVRRLPRTGAQLAQRCPDLFGVRVEERGTLRSSSAAFPSDHADDGITPETPPVAIVTNRPPGCALGDCGNLRADQSDARRKTNRRSASIMMGP